MGEFGPRPPTRDTASPLRIGPALDGAAVLAARLCDAPMAFVSLIGDGRPGFTPGMPQAWVDDAGSLAALITTVGPDAEVLVFPDVRIDDRFAGEQLMSGPPFARFLAVTALIGSDGVVLGAVCVLDTVTRDLTPQQRADLTVLAGQVAHDVESTLRSDQQAAELATLRKAYQVLSDRERLLDGVLAHSDVLVYAKDLQERFVYANDALERAVGIAGGLIGKANHEVFPSEWAEEYRKNDEQIAVTGGLESFDETFVDSGGVTHQLRSAKYPLHDESGRVYAIAGVSTDVTELASARMALSEAEQRWRSLVEHSAVGVGVIEADCRITYLNPAGLVLCGAAPADTIEGRDVRDLLPEHVRPVASRLISTVLAGRSTRESQRWPIRRLDGREVTVELHAAPVIHQGGRAVQVQLRDVSARIAAEDALLASERRFRAVFEDSPVAIALSDAGGRWVDVNSAFCELYGRESSALLGATAADFAHPDDRHFIDGSEEGQLRSPDGVHRFEARFFRGDGEVRRSWITINAIPGPNGQAWTLAVVEDITSRRAAENALRASEAELAAIAEVARCVQSGADPRPVVLRSVRKLSGAATVTMIEAFDGTTLTVTGCQGAEMVGESLPLPEPSVSAQVWRSGRPEFSADVALLETVSPLLDLLPGTVSALWQPVIVSGAVQAVLLVTWTHQLSGPGDPAVRAVRTLADEAATSLNATRLRRELERSAMTDPLTGSLNRRAWDTALQDHAVRARTTRAPLTLALVDLDRFKRFNDAHGHSAGDALLRDFAAAARACLRKNDIFARWGGEEFSIALPDVDPDAAQQVLDRIRRCVPQHQTCSIGFTVWDPDEPMSKCVTRADAALYDAKHGGRDRLCFRPVPSVADPVQA